MSKTPLSTEELLKPRYMIMADYPGNRIKVGSILQSSSNNMIETLVFCIADQDWVKSEELDKYPHLFRPMPWYEGRKAEEMPEYLKWGRIVLKNPSYNHSGFYAEGVGWINFKNNEVSPSNAAEYEAYINSKQ